MYTKYLSKKKTYGKILPAAPIMKPRNSPLVENEEFFKHPLVGKEVTAVRKITPAQVKDKENAHYGMFIQIDGRNFVCIDFANSLASRPDEVVLANVSGSMFLGKQVEAGYDHNGITFVAVNFFTFMSAPEEVKIVYAIPDPEDGIPDHPDLRDRPSFEWQAIMQIARQECRTCSEFMMGGCCESGCDIWDLKVAAHKYHKDLYENPCDYCPRSADHQGSLGGMVENTECSKCPLQIQYGFGITEGGEVNTYYISPDEIRNLARPDTEERLLSNTKRPAESAGRESDPEWKRIAKKLGVYKGA